MLGYFTTNNLIENNIIAGSIPFRNGTFKAILLNSSAPVGTSSTYSNVSSYQPSGSGYTSSTIEVSITGGDNQVINLGTASFTASGGSITARYIAYYENATGNLCGYCLLDSTNVDVTITDGNTLNVQDVNGAIILADTYVHSVNSSYGDVTITASGLGAEVTTNKVTSFQSTTDNTHYPSEKLVKDSLDTKVDKVTGKGLSTNDLTDALKANYDAAYTHSQAAHAPADAQANVLEGVQVNGTDLTITSKKVNLTADNLPNLPASKITSGTFADERIASADTWNAKVGSVSLASGTNNGTLKLTVDGTATDNVAVTGLGTAAYKADTYFEAVSNKVTSISSSSTDTQFPSAKAVYDYHDSTKLDRNSTIVGSTKCKISYDTNGLVTAGSDLNQSDITTALGYTPYNNSNPNNYITKNVDDLTNYTSTINLADVALSNNYNDLYYKPTIPTNTNQLTNGSGYITKSVNNLTNYSTTTAMNTAISSYHDSTKADASALTTHTGNTNNPHSVTKAQVGLGNVPNTDFTTPVSTLQTDVDNIEALIPNEAVAVTNILADKAFVNSSISTNTATFRGTSASGLTEAQFLAWANGLTKTNNDYVFWNTTDTDGNVVFKRYKYNGTDWVYEYSLNNSSFTASQWASINSGITSSLVDDYSDHISDTTIHVTSTDKSTWNGKQNAITSSNKLNANLVSGLASVATSGSYTDLSNKPSIPTKTSDLTNDSGYITSSYHDASKQDVLTAGSNIQINGTTISATDTIYTLPTASDSTKGGVKIGSNLTMNGEVLSATDTTYTAGTNISITDNIIAVSKTIPTFTYDSSTQTLAITS